MINDDILVKPSGPASWPPTVEGTLKPRIEASTARSCFRMFASGLWEGACLWERACLRARLCEHLPVRARTQTGTRSGRLARDFLCESFLWERACPRFRLSFP